MRSGAGYLPIESTAPLRGLFTAQASNRLDPSFTPEMLNGMVRDGELTSRFGYDKIGQTLDGQIRGFEQFAPLGGVTSLVVMTTRRQYYYDGANDVFVDVSRRDDENTESITVVGTGAGGTFTIGNTDNSTHFLAGDIFLVTGSTNNNKEFTVASSIAGPPCVITVIAGDTVGGTADGIVNFSHNYAITAANPSANRFVIPGLHAAEFPVGQAIRIENATNSHDGWYNVSVISESGGTQTNIVVTPGFTGADDPGNNGNLLKIAEFTTGALQFIDWAEITDVNSRRMIVCNGVDSPVRWSGTLTSEFREWRPTFTNFTTMRTIEVFSGHLFLGSVTLSSTGEAPQEITWSNANDFDDFDGGTSGVQILSDLETAIKHMRILGDRMVIYSDNQIINTAFVGGAAIFAFETVIPEGTRLVGPTGVMPINIGHVYVGQENIYLYDGSKGLRVIGQSIRNDFKATLDIENVQKVATLNDFAKRTVYIAIPDVSETSFVSVVYTFEYDIFNPSKIVWGKEIYNDDVRAFGFLTNTVTVTWLDTVTETANTPWNLEVGTWIGEGEQVGFPVRVFGNEAGEVFRIAETQLQDDGTAFTLTYDTVDFTVPKEFQSEFGRWGEIEFEAKGQDVDVLVSGDLGANFTTIETARTLNGSYTTHQVPIDFFSRNIRVRFQTDTTFALRWVKVWVRDGGAR